MIQLLQSVESIFSEGGFLRQTLGMDHRPQQESMAIHTSQSMMADQALLFEAGTGVGKSLAYLIPGIIHAVANQRKMIVSSHTIALQEQIVRKDLLHCRRLFSETEVLTPYASFQAALLKGKANYLCNFRLNRALTDKQGLFSSQSSEELERLIRWAREKPDGTYQDLDFKVSDEVWDWVNAESPLCNRKNCNPETCSYQRAREIVDKAHLVVVNHALLFSLLGAGMHPSKQVRGILLPDDFVVLDEAHTVPEIATDHFGLSLSRVGVERLLHQLFNPRTNKGLMTRYRSEANLGAVMDALEASSEFFAHIEQQFLAERSPVRMQIPGWAENVMQQPLQRLADTLAGIAQKETNENAEAEVSYYRKRILHYRDSIRSAIELEENDHVYWVARDGKRGSNISLRSAPLNVAPYLREHLFDRQTSCILTSATLQDAEGMDRFANQVGANGVPHHAEASPFDYPRQMAINIASDAPVPNQAQADGEIAFLTDSIAFCVSRVPGGTFALFKSYRDMNLVAERIKAGGLLKDRVLWVQGAGISRELMLESFRKQENAVLFGTDSFWTGVDVPGKALSQVIVTRIPFDHPGDPVLEARSEAVREMGLDPFSTLSVPAAQIRFRQGLGRLIRNQSDRGVLTILDSRILKKNYGKSFISILPHADYATFTRFNRDQKFRGVPTGK
jgi:ATP-dependent DNA helicase DinG